MGITEEELDEICLRVKAELDRLSTKETLCVLSALMGEIVETEGLTLPERIEIFDMLHQAWTQATIEIERVQKKEVIN